MKKLNLILKMFSIKERFYSALNIGCKAILIVIYILNALTSSSQAQNFSAEILSEKFNTYQEEHFVEKLYFHTDRDYYIAGEIVWFSAYAFSAENTFTGISSVVYIELIDDEEQVVLKEKISLKEGQGSGSLYLPVSLESGVFTLRAYTRWMRNEKPSYFFQKPLTVVNTFVSNAISGKTSDEFDVQFLPEGGNLLAGHDNRIAFKALNSAGKGVGINGVLLNASGDTLLQFKDDHKGMGSFTFTPSTDSSYTSKIAVGEKILEKTLPKVVSDGYNIRVFTDAQSLEVKSITTYNEPYLTLFVHHNGKVIVASTLDVNDGKTSFKMNLNEMGTGIHHFTLFNSRGKPVAERLYFKMPKKNEIIKIQQAQYEPSTRQKLTLSIENVTKMPARLSLGVTLQDSLEAVDQVDIRSWMWLLSDLEGYVEAPQYYFTAPKEEANRAMESLMLTQGWRRFEWENVMNPKPLENIFLPEMEGPVFEAYIKDKETGQPAEWVESYLSFPGKYFRFYAQKSDENGKLTFALRNVEGPQVGILRGFTDTDSTWQFTITDPFEQRIATQTYPQLVLDEKLQNTLASRSISMQAQNIYIDQKLHQFEKKAVDTIPFYGTPDQHYVLDDYTRFPTMEEVMREYVPKVAVRKSKNKYRYKVFDLPNEIFFQYEPLILLDGMPILNTNEVLQFNPFKIKSLDVISRRFIMNRVNFTGLVSYRTYDGDYTWQKPHEEDFVFDYDGVQEKRIFYQPAYENNEKVNKRLPDFRTSLYWNPDLQLNANSEVDVSFFTSDKTGKFKGVIQGLTQDGQPIYHTFNFEVNKVSN